jgi:hypothetical protein
MSKELSTHGRHKKSKQNVSKNLHQRNRLEDLNINGNLITT